ncbi:MAG: hypothetical protein IKI94_04435 [Ruminococcus sp.]|nr:hypothetical protein [Ruminococcus sp.]
MKENIFEKICSDTSVVLPDNSELNDMLEAEIAKENPDTELIDELISAIAENDNLIIPDVDVESEFFSIKRKAGTNRRKGFFKQKRAAIAAVIALVAAGNICTLTVFGENLFTAAFRKGEQILIDLSKIETDSESSEYDFSPPTTDDDPYGIRYFCSIYDEVPPVVPTWIPDNISYCDVIYSKSGKQKNISIEFDEYAPEKNAIELRFVNIYYHFFNNHDDMIKYAETYRYNNDTEQERIIIEDDYRRLTSYIFQGLNNVHHDITIMNGNTYIYINCINMTDEEACAILDGIR